MEIISHYFSVSKKSLADFRCEMRRWQILTELGRDSYEIRFRGIEKKMSRRSFERALKSESKLPEERKKIETNLYNAMQRPEYQRYYRMWPIPRVLLEDVPEVPEGTKLSWDSSYYGGFGFPYEVKKGSHGLGLFATRSIGYGELIAPFSGSSLPSVAYSKARSDETYSISLRGGRVISPCRSACVAAFANHSCEPNCSYLEIVVCYENPKVVVYIVADEEIDEGDEITTNYSVIDETHLQECHCGSSLCRGYIGTEEAIAAFLARQESGGAVHGKRRSSRISGGRK
ncbi:hypothetical protein ADUPG1_010063 [Aduncisulcus paluster]|uniref:SET domain-containing protein n=1 Tax=Aduncisulcus paluster TaxID=2918883 RepID=A0ABQ5KXQ4_9EUKA|nr:hypothetical protein ADUPG1_010063 [Aduncisulcus paluster]